VRILHELCKPHRPPLFPQTPRITEQPLSVKELPNFEQ
jgi:hypothetical protein